MLVILKKHFHVLYSNSFVLVGKKTILFVMAYTRKIYDAGLCHP